MVDARGAGTPVLPPRLRRARLGTTATFALDGAVCAVWLVRIPALTDKLHLDPARVGTAVLASGVGAMLAMQAARHLIGQLGSRRILLVAAPGTALLSAGVGLAPGYGWLLAATLLFGAAFGVLDIGMNAQAATLERVAGRHLMNGAHAGWSVGSVLGGGFGALTALLGIGFTGAVVAMAVLSLPVALALTRTYLPDPPPPATGRRRRTPLPRVIYLIGVVTLASFVVEGAVADWSGLYLRDELGAREAVAALAYPGFEAAMIIGRVSGDRVRRGVGSRAMLVGGGCLVVAGFAVAVAARSWWLALAGFVLVGLGTCTVVPLTFSIAGAVDPSGSGAGIAQAGAMGYAGMLTGPVAIGYLADATSVRVALLVGAGLGAVTAALGRLLPAPVAAGAPALAPAAGPAPGAPVPAPDVAGTPGPARSG